MKELHTYKCTNCAHIWKQYGKIATYLASPNYMRATCCMFVSPKLIEIEFIKPDKKVDAALEFNRVALSN